MTQRLLGGADGLQGGVEGGAIFRVRCGHQRFHRRLKPLLIPAMNAEQFLRPHDLIGDGIPIKVSDLRDGLGFPQPGGGDAPQFHGPQPGQRSAAMIRQRLQRGQILRRVGVEPVTLDGQHPHCVMTIADRHKH